jgi:uncharacterized protein (DUF2267 family)
MDAPTFIRRTAELTGLDKEHAERALRVILVTLGTRLDPGEADDLASQLPAPFGALLRHESKPERFPPEEMVRRVVHLVPLSNEQAHRAIRAVFAVLAEAVSEGELEDVLGQLSADYSGLVGLPTGRNLQRR